MTSTTVVNYYAPNMRTEVSVDASHVGLGAILAHREDDYSIGLYRENAISIQNESGDSNGGNV